jgi:DNA repair protein RAD16
VANLHLQVVSSAAVRAAALRNSEFANRGASTVNKRKRYAISSDEEDADDDNSKDAQLARALQQEEEAAVSGMGFHNGTRSSNGKPRKVQKILPKSDYIPDSDEEFEDIVAAVVSATKPKVELAANGSNGVSFVSKNKSAEVIPDTDESEDLSILDDSDVDELISPQSRIRTLSTRSVHKSSPRRSQMPPPPKKAPVKKAPLKKAPAKTHVKKQYIRTSAPASVINSMSESEFGSEMLSFEDSDFSTDDDGSDVPFPTTDSLLQAPARRRRNGRQLINNLEDRATNRQKLERQRLELHHPELNTMWQDLENLPKIGQHMIEQPKNINRELKPFQLQGVAWMKAMEETEWGGGLLGDEMGMGKTIQAVSLIMSDWPAKNPTLVLIPPVALMQWQQEIADYTDGTLKTFVYHGTNSKTKGMTEKQLREYNVILMSYNSLEAMYRRQEKGNQRKSGLYKEKSLIHKLHFHRVILDEAHNIKVGSSFFCEFLNLS